MGYTRASISKCGGVMGDEGQNDTDQLNAPSYPVMKGGKVVNPADDDRQAAHVAMWRSGAAAPDTDLPVGATNRTGTLELQKMAVEDEYGDDGELSAQVEQERDEISQVFDDFNLADSEMKDKFVEYAVTQYGADEKQVREVGVEELKRMVEEAKVDVSVMKRRLDDKDPEYNKKEIEERALEKRKSALVEDVEFMFRRWLERDEESDDDYSVPGFPVRMGGDRLKRTFEMHDLRHEAIKERGRVEDVRYRSMDLQKGSRQHEKLVFNLPSGVNDEGELNSIQGRKWIGEFKRPGTELNLVVGDSKIVGLSVTGGKEDVLLRPFEMARLFGFKIQTKAEDGKMVLTRFDEEGSPSEELVYDSAEQLIREGLDRVTLMGRELRGKVGLVEDGTKKMMEISKEGEERAAAD